MIISLRRLTTLLAAVAFVNATAAPVLAGCEDAHAAVTESDLLMPVSEHSADAGSDCPESEAPAKREHSPECFTGCTAMVGCSAPFFVAESLLSSVSSESSPAPALATQPHPTRVVAPDRPPPKA